MKKNIYKFINDFSKLEKKKKIILITTLLTVIAYGAACTKALYHSNNKILEKQEPQGLKSLRPGLETVSKENDPLLREYKIQEEAAKSKKTASDYRSLLESYRKNKVEFLPEYPQAKWSLLAWGFWYFQRVTPQKRVELAKNSFLVILEKGTLITAAIGVGKWLLESPQRRKRGQHEAWQIIHMVQHNKGSGARVTALEDLNRQKVSLSGLELANKDLQGICLKEANLSGANLSDAYLRGANLGTATLNFADLAHADLRSTYLVGTNLVGTNLVGTNLGGANLSGANLVGTNLGNANLSGANLSGANLRGANLSGADLRKANLKGAELTKGYHNSIYIDSDTGEAHNANLSNANLCANLQDANLQDANLKGADFTYARNLAVEQIKAAKNWEQAKYSPEFRAELGLPPETPTTES